MTAPGLLRQRNFGLFFAATSVSTLGTAVALIGISLALLVSGYSASAVGFVLAAETVPMLLLMPAGGVAGDRWPRRRLMVAADVLRCASQATLAACLASGHPALPMLMGLAACCGVGNAFYGPAERGLVPQVADADRLQSANSLVNLAGSLSIVIGPALGGLLVGLGGGAIAIGLDAASYGVSAALLSLVRLPRHPPLATSPAFLRDFRLGWAEFRRHRWLQLMLAQTGLQNAFILGLFFVIGPSLYASRPGGAQSWGLVTSGVGAGGLAGGLLALRASFPRPLLVIQAGATVMTLPVILLALGASLPALIAASCAFGVAMAISNILFQTAVQQSVPADALSRVSSLVGLVAMGLTPLGYGLSGPVASLLGTGPALGLGAGIMLASVVAMLACRSIRSFGQPQSRNPQLAAAP